MFEVAAAGLLPPVLAMSILALPRRAQGAVGLARTFALAASLVVVFGELLPESAEDLGPLALWVFVAGLAAPSAIGALLHRGDPHGHSHASFETGFVALATHQFVDGLQIGAIGGQFGPGVALAIAAHGAPLVAIAVLACQRQRTTRHAVGRGALLIGASAIGLAVGAQLEASWLAPIGPWLKAAVAGMLLHVLSHDLTADSPTTNGMRTADILAFAAGAVLPFKLLPAEHQHLHDHAHAATSHAAFGPALWELTVETAPTLLVGLALAAVVQTAGSRLQAAWQAPSTKADPLIGVAAGAALPVCACTIVPTGRRLVGHGVGPAFLVGFLLATPALGVETLALSVHYLGWELAILRLGGAVVAAVVAACVTHWMWQRTDHPGRAGHLSMDRHGSWWHHVRHAFDELLVHIAPWVGVGVLAAAYVEVTVNDAQAAYLASSGLDLPLIAFGAVPLYVCAPAAMPLAGVLWHKGLSAGAVLAGLILGPATHVATLGFLQSAFGRRAAGTGIAAMLVVVMGLGAATNAWLPAEAPGLLDAAPTHTHNVSWGSFWVVLLAAVGLQSVWRVGVRGWIATLKGDHSAHDRAHGHEGHGHSHPHDATRVH